MIDVVELKYQVVEVKRQKYVCGCGSSVETAIGPERAVEGGRYSLRFAIKVAFDKYVAHLPLERQARLMAHHGLQITSQTLWDQCYSVTRLFEPTYEAIYQRLRAGPVLGVDQTGWPDLDDTTLPLADVVLTHRPEAFRQAYTVASLTPCFLATSAIGILSASRRIFTICSSVNLDFRIAPPSLEGMLSGFSWAENSQAGHGRLDGNFNQSSPLNRRRACPDPWGLRAAF